jgi:pSer/pThr/pTyr-binding forkhead associated (FHA) protein
MSKIFAITMLAGIAGLAAWAICEPFSPPTFTDPRWSAWSTIFSLILGVFIGGCLGGFSGASQGSKTHFFRGLAIGGLLGGIGGVVGLKIGSAIVFTLFGAGVFGTAVSEGAALPIRILARTLVFVPLGAILGLTYGLGSRSLPRAIQGMIGGIIGGGVAGLLFDVVGEIFGDVQLASQGLTAGEVGALPRALTSILTGAGIGLFAGIVEALSKKAWIRLDLGRNEGKEWIVDAQQTFIGRSESAHIPLFGDANVQPMHACIVRERGTYRLVDGGSAVGIGVNGIRVPEAILNHGDAINVGSFTLRFLMKDQAAPVRKDLMSAAPPAAASLPVAPIPEAPPAARSLVVVGGPMSGQRYEVGQVEVIAGREGPDIRMAPDTTASRRHASFRSVGDSVMVRDLGSTNGTIVNGIRVQEMSLRPGDTVRIGATTLRVE